MFVVLATAAAADSAFLWGAIVVALGVAVATGFVSGLMASPWLQQWALRRAHSRVEQLCDRVLKDLERSQQACQLLTTAALSHLPAAQIMRFDTVREDLTGLLNELSSSMRSAEEKSRKPPKTIRLDWVRTPIDPDTSLPDETAFQANLNQLLETGARASQPSGLLLLQIDKADQLRFRVGAAGVAKLRNRLAGLVVRSVADTDLVCSLERDQFVILMPARWPLDAIRQAQQIRTAIREHRFRIGEDTPEILVTASFGFSAALPAEPAALVLDRARDALERSRAAGRNQLHVHDGTHRQSVRLS